MSKDTIAVVDSLYAETATLLVGSDEKPITVSRRRLPIDVQEGQILLLSFSLGAIRCLRMGSPIDGDAVPESQFRAIVDHNETERRRKRIRRINARLTAG